MWKENTKENGVGFYCGFHGHICVENSVVFSGLVVGQVASWMGGKS